jgi:RimJ/RimL family protein N-acetyltransferase
MSLPTPTLHTARLLLRPFTESDTDSIFALHSSSRVSRYWDAPPWSERARAERFIAVCKQMEQEASGARLAIERASLVVPPAWNWRAPASLTASTCAAPCSTPPRGPKKLAGSANVERSRAAAQGHH